MRAYPLLSFALVVLALALPARPAADDAEGLRAVLVGDTGYVLGPIEPVAALRVESIHPAPTGRYVLALQEQPERLPPPGESAETRQALIHWDARTRRATTLWRQPKEPGAPQASVVGYFPGTAVALVSFTRILPGRGGDEIAVRESLRRVNAVTASLAPASAESVGIAVQFSPTRPMAVVQQPDGAFTLTATGESRPLPLPEGATCVGWLPDGESVYALRVERGPDRKIRARSHWIVSTRTRQARQVEKAPELADGAPDPTPPIAVRQAKGTARDGDSATPVRPLWLEKAQPALPKTKPDPKAKPAPEPPFTRALVAADSDSGGPAPLVLPDASAVLWTQDGTLYARTLLALDRTAFDNLLRTLQRRKAVSEAKQMGLALMMYAMDYDETFPSSGQGMDMVLPYLKDEAMLGRFTFTYQGNPSLGKIDAPADTPLGFVRGPGGRAVVYADGHARWQDD